MFSTIKFLAKKLAPTALLLAAGLVCLAAGVPVTATLTLAAAFVVLALS